MTGAMEYLKESKQAANLIKNKNRVIDSTDFKFQHSLQNFTYSLHSFDT